MAEMVDARGLACPQPVIQTRKAMQSGATQVVTLVDNETSLTNVSRMAKKAGWQVHVTTEGNDYRIEMQRDDAAPPATEPQPAPVAASGPLVLVISADVMGRGNDELGGILIRGFFHTLGEVESRPQTLIFFNTGVKLACEGSPVLEDLRVLEESGITMLACGTCLDYLNLKERLAVGQVSNMYDIAETILGAGKVVYL